MINKNIVSQEHEESHFHSHLKPPSVFQKANAALDPPWKTQGDAAQGKNGANVSIEPQQPQLLEMPNITTESWTGANLERPKSTVFCVMKWQPSHWSKPVSTAPFLVQSFLWQQSFINTEAEIQPKASHQERFYGWNLGQANKLFPLSLGFFYTVIFLKGTMTWDGCKFQHVTKKKLPLGD